LRAVFQPFRRIAFVNSLIVIGRRVRFRVPIIRARALSPRVGRVLDRGFGKGRTPDTGFCIGR
jgi:hypothetical protein